MAGPLRHQSSSTISLSNSFPSLRETTEMARLSSLIYKFHRFVDDDLVCPMINADYSAYGVECHWYSHRGGNASATESSTQVMIVSSKTYVAVVFAGTDDLESSLTDVHLLQTPFGDTNHTLPNHADVKVHAGFNQAVFSDGLYDAVCCKLEQLYESQATWMRRTKKKLYVTGHSLGAANSALTAVALTLHSSQYFPNTITSINFGCPRIGNAAYKDYIHNNPLIRSLSIWRVVLGWDLVARLPELYYHAGHTIQLYETVKNDTWSSYWWPSNSSTAPVAYYRHYGDSSLNLAGVPFGWYAMPYMWLPGALNSHRMSKYYAAMSEMQQDDWVKAFVPLSNGSAVIIDDDEWKNPDDLSFIDKQ
ncbi:hypothetical protein MPSEU_001066600 [Mayamaea pseudoterrestris]|nr:hypothetical protein MPSEU_001066600 [Mayamaea pseudoterrestris]